jgi:hypothetical protein
MRWLDNIPWEVVIVGALALGLAPFVPEPHLVEKIRMLFQGTLSRPIDIFDLFMHGAFPVLLLLKIARTQLIKNEK